MPQDGHISYKHIKSNIVHELTIKYCTSRVAAKIIVGFTLFHANTLN